jgi:ribonuclease HI
MPWIARKLRGNKVFVRTEPDGRPVASADGRVEVIYKLEDGAKVYRAALRNLEPTGDPADELPREPGAGSPRPARAGKPAVAGPAAADDPNAIIIYTDGACTGNPGPAGIGVVIVDGTKRKELSQYLGQGTNNIAELTAIERALTALRAADRHRPIRLHTDSSYSIGVLTKGWKAKANQQLIARIRALTSEFEQLVFVKVRGHSGILENERADELARRAIAES